MLSFFKKNKAPIAYTQEGSHGRHWYGIFDEVDEITLKESLINTVKNGTPKIIDKNTRIMDSFFIRSVMHRDEFLTAFP